VNSAKSKPFHWRSDVRSWLQAVLQYHQQTGLSFHTAATQHQATFPRSDWVVLEGTVYRGLATWAVKSAIREAAMSANISLDDATVDFLADLAVSVLLPAA
jgi:hypothetical protein